jgi:hypothetical protein
MVGEEIGRELRMWNDTLTFNCAGPNPLKVLQQDNAAPLSVLARRSLENSDNQLDN